MLAAQAWAGRWALAGRCREGLGQRLAAALEWVRRGQDSAGQGQLQAPALAALCLHLLAAGRPLLSLEQLEAHMPGPHSLLVGLQADLPAVRPSLALAALGRQAWAWVWAGRWAHHALVSQAPRVLGLLELGQALAPWAARLRFQALAQAAQGQASQRQAQEAQAQRQVPLVVLLLAARWAPGLWDQAQQTAAADSALQQAQALALALGCLDRWGQADRWALQALAQQAQGLVASPLGQADLQQLGQWAEWAWAAG